MLEFRKAILDDSAVYFEWTNDEVVRNQSFNSEVISWEEHCNWFLDRVNNPSCLMLIFNDVSSNVGQVRIQEESDKNVIIGISVGKEHRGKGYAKLMLELASDYFLSENPEFCIHAYIKSQNLHSKFAFEKAGFDFVEMTTYKDHVSYHYIKIKNKK
ncbi:GNAT family N-acetyltransferase [Flavobacterium fluviale]|uniref:N-acetyltransferase n=1 Tax=Flavobacterium fluviale TaxID=2249356 RepID=A0A344LN91_9FLAO|nr:GNAT family N-acetyltransferase [Flavobacterium fluviale]AXB55383.1 N-acetyltransferase [Flavobacterium fluviale]